MLVFGPAVCLPAPAAATVGSTCNSKLPAQAHDTLDQIDSGGPFSFPQDGDVFANKGRVLPKQATGYYHEYTVVTPGSSDRGSRRIITGQATREDYYTTGRDNSFEKIDFSC
ncbi:ribonuclease [Nocardia sp. NBC_01499]|uniref:ribonuclease domain-containing protein n=1 Tax=Nocardia sp. NBC_01499 TaxID=2903597 RepID=UPI00386FD1A8